MRSLPPLAEADEESEGEYDEEDQLQDLENDDVVPPTQKERVREESDDGKNPCDVAVC